MRSVPSPPTLQPLRLIGSDRPEAGQQTTLGEYFAALERSYRHPLREWIFASGSFLKQRGPALS